jgi:hypothetical protein
MKLTTLDQKHIAVILEQMERTFVMRGIAPYEVDDEFGNCLRVRIHAESGDPHFIFSEAAEGDFQRDDRYGCDFSIVLRFDGDGSFGAPKENAE